MVGGGKSGSAAGEGSVALAAAGRRLVQVCWAAVAAVAGLLVSASLSDGESR